MRLQKRRGILLIISLILVVVLVVFISAAGQLSLGNLSENRHSKNAVAAENAAHSGLEYCRSQLRQDPTWRGDRNTITVNLPDLIVTENQGNIAGLVRSPDGTWSQFRCRFNFQDGPGGADGFPEDPAFQVDMTDVSVSNIVGFGPMNVPLADGSNYSVAENSEISHRIPTWAAYLAVEGRAGLRDVDPTRPEEAYSGVVRLIKAVVSVRASDEPLVAAAGMAGGNVTVDLGSGSLTVTAESGTPRLRSKGEANLSGGSSVNYVSDSGEVRTPSATLGANYDSSEVTLAAEQPDDPFFQLLYSDVRKANSGDTLPGGTYVWWDDGSLHYYDMSHSEYVAFMADPLNVTDPGTTDISFPPSTQIVNSGGIQKLVVTGDVQVASSANGVDSFAVIPRKGAAEVPPGDSEFGGTVDAAAVLDYVGTNNSLILDFLSETQGGQGGLELTLNGQDFIEVGWSAPDNEIEFEFSNGATREDLIAALFELPSGGNWDQAPAPILDTASVAQAIGMDSGSGSGVIELGSVQDNLTASDVALEFTPTAGGSAILSADGDIRLTGSINGAGGSLVSGGEIRVTGVGSSFASADNPVNMYAQGDIFLSTLDEVNGSSGTYEFADLNLKGIVYTQGNLVTRLGSDTLPASDWGSLTVDGVVVAYGGDPNGEAGVSGGDFDFRASQVNLNYSQTYIGALGIPAAGFGLDIAAWNNRI